MILGGESGIGNNDASWVGLPIFRIWVGFPVSSLPATSAIGLLVDRRKADDGSIRRNTVVVSSRITGLSPTDADLVGICIGHAFGTIEEVEEESFAILCVLHLLSLS